MGYLKKIIWQHKNSNRLFPIYDNCASKDVSLFVCMFVTLSRKNYGMDLNETKQYSSESDYIRITYEQ